MSDIRDRIRKLLNLAEGDGAAAGEIENALRFADRLMSEHNLTRAEVMTDGHAAAGEAERADRFAKVDTYAQGERHTNWEGWLSGFVAELVGGVYVYLRNKEPVRGANGLRVFDKQGQTVYAAGYCFYGDAEGVQIAKEMFDDLGRTIAAMGRLLYGGCFRGDGKAYAEGFVLGLRDQMQKDRQAERAGTAQPAAPGAIVLSSTQRATLDRYHEGTQRLAKSWLASAHGVNLGSARRGGSVSCGSPAFAAGRSDGARASISKGRAPKIGGGGGGYARSLPG